jgi:hypothetical protein
VRAAADVREHLADCAFWERLSSFVPEAQLALLPMGLRVCSLSISKKAFWEKRTRQGALADPNRETAGGGACVNE